MSPRQQMRRTTRLFTDVYDYNARRNLKSFDSNISFQDALLSRMRLDALLFDKVVLSDAQLFHSLFLVETAFSQGSEFFASQLPLESLEIRMRGKDLQSSLVELVKPTNSEYLNGHLFTYIDPTGSLRETLRATKSEKITDWESVLNLLISISSDEMKDRLKFSKSAWKYYIEMSLRSLETHTWRTDFAFEKCLKSYIDASEWQTRENLRTDRGYKIYEDMKHRRKQRGDLAAILLKSDGEALYDEEHEDLELIDRVFSAAFNLTYAEQHFCNATDTSKYGAVRQIKNDHSNQNDYLSLPLEAVYGLCDLPSSSFQELSQATSTLRQKWQYSGDREYIGEIGKHLIDRIHLYSGLKELKAVDETALSQLIPFIKKFGAIDTMAKAVAFMSGDCSSLISTVIAPVKSRIDYGISAFEKQKADAVKTRLVSSFVNFAEDRKYNTK